MPQDSSEQPIMHAFPIKGWRVKVLTHVPWVKRLTKPVLCDGIKWSTVALKDLFMHGPGNQIPPRGIQPRSKCKSPAYWKFTALKKSRAKSGNYCYSHLWSAGFYGDQYELNRFDKWWNSNKELIEKIRAGEEK